MSIEQLIEQIKQRKEEIVKIEKNIVKLFEKSKDLPLEERWKLFQQAEEYLPKSCSIIHLDSLPVAFIGYDCLFHAERYQQVYFAELVETIQNAVKYSMKDGVFTTRNSTLSDFIDSGCDLLGINNVKEFNARIDDCLKAKLDIVKLEILESGYGSFEYDW